MAFKDIAFIKENYPAGTRVELININDPYARIYPGDKGTVYHVDDAGTIHVNWDDGGTLGLIYGEDSFRKIRRFENG